MSFLFAVFAIGVEDERAIDSLRRSWALASGNRWRLFALLLIVAVISGVGGAFGTVFSFVSPLVGQIGSLAVTSVLAIVGYGIIADAYLQLRDEDAGGTGGAEAPDPAEAAI